MVVTDVIVANHSIKNNLDNPIETYLYKGYTLSLNGRVSTWRTKQTFIFFYISANFSIDWEGSYYSKYVKMILVVPRPTTTVGQLVLWSTRPWGSQ